MKNTDADHITITFRLSRRVTDLLRKEAEADYRSINSLVNKILAEWAKERSDAL